MKKMKKMKKLKKEKKNVRVTIGIIIGSICLVGALIYVGVDAYRTANTPVTMPSAIAISYDAESGNWQAEDIGEPFTWEGYWPADENVMKNLEIMEEMGQEQFWEVYGNEK